MMLHGLKLRLAITIFLFLLIQFLYSQNINVNDFGGEGSSFFIKSEFENGDHLLILDGKNGGLDINDLNRELSKGKVIIKNPIGGVSFAPGLFKPTYENSTLEIVAKGDVYITVSAATISKINISIDAQGDVRIDGPGINTRGGNFYSSGQKLTIKNSGLKTGNGNVSICHLDTVSISGEGIKSDQNDISIHGNEVMITNFGIESNGGICNITAADDVNISGNGIRANSFISSGENFSVTHDGIRVENEGISIYHSGKIQIIGGMVTDGSGIFVKNAEEIYISHKGLNTNGGDVKIDGYSKLNIKGQGIVTDGGNFTSKGKHLFVGGEDNHEGNGIQTSGGDIIIDQEGDLLVRANGIFSESGDIKIFCKGKIDIDQGGVSTENGDISVHSKSSIRLAGFNLNTNNGEKVGAGALDTSSILQNTLILVSEPVLGGGDINIMTSK